MVGIFDDTRDKHCRDKPFPHIYWTQALAPDYDRELAATYREIPYIRDDIWAENNMAKALSATRAYKSGGPWMLWEGLNVSNRFN